MRCAPTDGEIARYLREKLFYILNLLSYLLNLVFQRKSEACYFQIVGLGTYGVGFAVKFLNEEIELAPHESFFADFSELRNMRM